MHRAGFVLIPQAARKRKENNNMWQQEAKQHGKLQFKHRHVPSVSQGVIYAWQFMTSFARQLVSTFQ
jgi:hypothetical protein